MLIHKERIGLLKPLHNTQVHPIRLPNFIALIIEFLKVGTTPTVKEPEQQFRSTGEAMIICAIHWKVIIGYPGFFAKDHSLSTGIWPKVLSGKDCLSRQIKGTVVITVG